MRTPFQALAVSGPTRGLRRLANGSVWLLGVALLGLAPGCTSEACQRDPGVATRYTGGTTTAGGTQYETSSWDGPWLTFPSGSRYRLEHHLRARPVDMNIWVSLDDKPFEQGEDTKQAVTPSAGNQSWLLSITDKDIVVHNDTCADMFIRLTAWTAAIDNSEQSMSDAAVPDAAIPDAAIPDAAADAN